MTWLQSCNMEEDCSRSADMGSSIDTNSLATFCPLCTTTGKKGRLRLFQINLTEAVVMCSSKQCTYPMGVLPSTSIVIQRDASVATFSKKRRSQPLVTPPTKHPRLSEVNAAPTCSNPPISSKQHLLNVPSLRPCTMADGVATLPSRKNVFQSIHLKKSNTTFQSYSAQVASQSNLVIERTGTNTMLDRELDKKDNRGVTENKGSLLSGITDNDIFLLPGISDNKLSQSSSLSDNKVSLSSTISDNKVSLSSKLIYPQWLNTNSSCWLDALLCILVHNKHLQVKVKQNTVDSILLAIIKAYNVTQLLCEQVAKKINGEKHSSINRITQLMNGQRDRLWQILNTRMHCVHGKGDSTTCGLMSLLHTEPHEVQQLMTVQYTLSGSCEQCNYIQPEEILEKRVLTFSELPTDFCMEKPHQHRKCVQCTCGSVNVYISITKFPSVLFCHFVCGLPGNRLTDYDFQSPGGAMYKVRGVIQYKKNPDHFVTWVRDTSSDLWMECDDLKDVLCSHTVEDPGFPLSDAHLVMWEVHGSEVRQNHSEAASKVGQTRQLNIQPTNHRQDQVMTVQEKSKPGKCLQLLSAEGTGLLPGARCDRTQQPKETNKQGRHGHLIGSNGAGQNLQNSFGNMTTDRINLCIKERQNNSVFLEISKKPDDAMSDNQGRALPKGGGNISCDFPPRPQKGVPVDRVQRMRQKFLREKPLKKNKSVLPDRFLKAESAGSVPKLQASVVSQNKGVLCGTPKNEEIKSTGARLTKQWSSGVGGYLKSALSKSPEQSTKVSSILSDTLSDRVLKYLPKGKFSLPLLKIEPPKPLERTVLNKRKNACFQGYTAKSNPTILEKPEQKSGTAKKDFRRSKNVKFSDSEDSEAFAHLSHMSASTKSKGGHQKLMLAINSPAVKRQSAMNIKSNTYCPSLNLKQSNDIKLIFPGKRKSIDPSPVKIKKPDLSIPGIMPIGGPGPMVNLHNSLDDIEKEPSYNDWLAAPHVQSLSQHSDDFSKGDILHSSSPQARSSPKKTPGSHVDASRMQYTSPNVQGQNPIELGCSPVSTYHNSSPASDHPTPIALSSVHPAFGLPSPRSLIPPPQCSYQPTIYDFCNLGFESNLVSPMINPLFPYHAISPIKPTLTHPGGLASFSRDASYPLPCPTILPDSLCQNGSMMHQYVEPAANDLSQHMTVNPNFTVSI